MIFKEIYRLKRVDNSDFPAIKELFWKVFKKKVSLSYLQNKYNTSYLGVKYICSIAYHNKIPVAFYGAIPQKFKNKDSEILVAHACDSYTLAAHQRKGLHYELAKLAYAIMKENNMKYVYAFHSENTYYSTKKLGWKEHKHMQRFHIKIFTLPVGKLLNKLNSTNLYNPFFKQNVSQDALKKLTSNDKEKFQLHVTQDFIKYKNSFKSHYCVVLEGCVFWLKIQAIIHVGQFYAPSEKALQKAIIKLKQRAFLLGISELLFQVDSNSIMAKQLQTIVQPKESWLVGYLDFDPKINLKDFIFTYSDLDTF
ncbi:GNAT family N-acetyltransferase [Oceanihabitans sp. 2_MG-2023]|uniref:GNAT family N-acetyltransferase n=1 Tax=Oceanihabitans sp. 2_MG-2023 TaxID=3062661 RepID=UPI0026E348B9|nr:GNAT family N-acetyltransferase [Oceanihabitans sp. 2_MG-2023]MDO6596415.1 GNAT family N-acetyltransferase [Oceanihabitans sp. 2_MG-2023]